MSLAKKITFALSILLVLLFLLGLTIYIVCNYFSAKTITPERLSNIPKEAIWYGGADGGVWIVINSYNNKDNLFYATVYFDTTGEIWCKGLFKYDYDRIISLEEVKEKINFYAGDDSIVLTEVGANHRYRVLNKIGD